MRLYLYLLAVSILSGSIARAQSLPEGEGREIVAETCNQCHELNIVTGSQRTEAQWQYTVTMMLSLGAPLPEDQVGTVVSYLAKNFGKPAAGETGTVAEDTGE